MVWKYIFRQVFDYMIWMDVFHAIWGNEIKIADICNNFSLYIRMWDEIDIYKPFKVSGSPAKIEFLNPLA